MKMLVNRTALSGLALLLAACAGMSPPNEQMSATADGARIWRTTCAGCHNLRPASEFDARQWPVIVSHMRTRADLTRSEAEAVAAFLSAAAANAAPVDTED